MAKERSKVSLVTDMDEVMKEMLPRTVLMVRPQLNRKYPNQRVTMTAEVVDLNTLNLAKMRTFEAL